MIRSRSPTCCGATPACRPHKGLTDSGLPVIDIGREVGYLGREVNGPTALGWHPSPDLRARDRPSDHGTHRHERPRANGHALAHDCAGAQICPELDSGATTQPDPGGKRREVADQVVM